MGATYGGLPMGATYGGLPLQIRSGAPAYLLWLTRLPMPAIYVLHT